MQKTSIALIIASASAMDINKSDSDGLFKLMDANVTRGNLKNLVTDKPSPITVGLAQKEAKSNSTKKDDDKIDHTLNGENVTIGALKGLVTDKPAPITEHVANKTAKNKNVSNAGVPHITTSNSTTTGPDAIIITAQKNSAKKSETKGDDNRVDHTSSGLDVTRGALKGLVMDATSPLTEHNVKNKPEGASGSGSNNTLPLLHHINVEDAAKGEPIHETPKANVTAWTLPADLA